MGGVEDEEDYGALIYRESQLRKAEAAAAAKDVKKKRRSKGSSADVSSTRRRVSSTRAISAGNAKCRPSSINNAQEAKASTRKRKSKRGEEQAPKKVV